MESLNDDKENLILSQIADVLENKCCEIKPFDDEHDIFLSQAVDCFELGMTLSQAVNTYDISETGSFDLGYNEDSLPNTNECFQEFKPKVTSLDLPSTSARFASPVSDNDIMQLKLSQINKNTAKNTNWSFSVFESWRNERSNDIPELHNMGKATMAFWLTRFIMEVRNAKGEEYPPKTLYQLICGLLRHIREKGVYDKNFLDNKDPCFSEFYSILDSRMKDLLQKGHGTTVKQADPITQEDEEKLWNLGVFGVSDPQTLQYTVFFYACKLFGLRGRDEHRDLKCSQFEIDQDKKGKYIRFIGRANKTYKGGLGQMSLTNKDIKHYCAEGKSKLILIHCLEMFSIV